MTAVRYLDATRTYEGTDTPAVDSLSLDIVDGELLVLVGPSGSGKSTALRMLAGLEPLDAGAIHIGDRDVSNVRPRDRDIAMVFQNYALYPQLSVAENMGFALKQQGVKKEERIARVKETARILDLEPYLKRRPGQLSGGQRQRVAMGRAIVRQPAVYLMDEPLSNLDAKLRVQMRAEIAQLQHRLGTTTIYVTHDQVEAMTMGHRVALLRDGVLQQVDTPSGIYNKPGNLFVAAFIGAPTMNLFSAELGSADGGMSLKLGSNVLSIPTSVLGQRPGLSRYVGKSLVVGFRPEDVADAAVGSAAATNRIRSTASLVEALGSDVLVHFTIDARPTEVQSSDPLQQIKRSASETGGEAIARLT